jgi:hypothetical protein
LASKFGVLKVKSLFCWPVQIIAIFDLSGILDARELLHHGGLLGIGRIHSALLFYQSGADYQTCSQ